jgi:hypothetical protein
VDIRDCCPECGGNLQFAVEDGGAIFTCVGLASEPVTCGWSVEIPRDAWGRAAKSAVIHRQTA